MKSRASKVLWPRSFGATRTTTSAMTTTPRTEMDRRRLSPTSNGWPAGARNLSVDLTLASPGAIGVTPDGQDPPRGREVGVPAGAGPADVGRAFQP
jgi:hypothetical protein